MLVKICETLGNASGSPLDALGELALGERDKISLAIEAAITGPDVDLDLFNGTTADMFGSLGLGTSALGIGPAVPETCPATESALPGAVPGPSTGTTSLPTSDAAAADPVASSVASSLGAPEELAALADTAAVLNFAGDISSAVTTEELYNAFLGEPSPAFLTIVDQIVKYEYPEFEDALNNKDAIESLFTNMGNLMPEAF